MNKKILLLIFLPQIIYCESDLQCPNGMFEKQKSCEYCDILYCETCEKKEDNCIKCSKKWYQTNLKDSVTCTESCEIGYEN